MGAAAASPVPGRANLGLVEQCYKYLPLQDPVTQPSYGEALPSCRSPSLGACAAQPPGVPPCPASWPGHWAAGPRGGWHSSVRIVWARTGGISATSTEWQMPAPQIPHLLPNHSQALLNKHNTPKPSSYSTTNALHETPTPTYTFTPSCCTPGTLHPLTQMQIPKSRSPSAPLNLK